MKEINIFTDTIDNRDTLFTIDQYQTFNLDFEYESQIDYLQSDDSKELRESYGLPDFDDETYLVDDYLDFSFDPDNSYHEALASAAIDIIEETDGKYGNSLEIFKSIRLEGIKSPQFYNYTTDSFVMTIEYDRDKLAAWISSNPERLETYISENPNLKFNDVWRYWGGRTPDSVSGNENWIEALYSVWLLTYIDFLYETIDNDSWSYYCEICERTSEAAYEAVQWEVRADKLQECEARKIQTIDFKDQLKIEGV